MHVSEYQSGKVIVLLLIHMQIRLQVAFHPFLPRKMLPNF